MGAGNSMNLLEKDAALPGGLLFTARWQGRNWLGPTAGIRGALITTR